jgi:protein-disulfide isomerase
MEAFKSCIASGEFKTEIVADFQEGSQLGVTGTPAFFINGRFVSGAQPYEAFEYIIEEELDRGPAG